VKLIVGLGNPGIEYQFTWHNLGFLAVDRIAGQYGAAIVNRRGRALTGKTLISGVQVLLAKPETYMNRSGESVCSLVEELELEPARDLIVVYDDLDLPIGDIRVRKNGGAGGHHGMESIIGALGAQNFSRIRLGISPGRKVGDGAQYVLSPFKKSQHDSVDQALEAAAEAVKVILTEGADIAMNRFNRKAETTAEAE
jgi:PTH1 family peptidyl-tRNA hydrolase